MTATTSSIRSAINNREQRGFSLWATYLFKEWSFAPIIGSEWAHGKISPIVKVARRGITPAVAHGDRIGDLFVRYGNRLTVDFRSRSNPLLVGPGNGKTGNPGREKLFGIN